MLVIGTGHIWVRGFDVCVLFSFFDCLSEFSIDASAPWSVANGMKTQLGRVYNAINTVPYHTERVFTQDRTWTRSAPNACLQSWFSGKMTRRNNHPLKAPPPPPLLFVYSRLIFMWGLYPFIALYFLTGWFLARDVVDFPSLTCRTKFSKATFNRSCRRYDPM